MDRGLKTARGGFARALALALCGILFTVGNALAQGAAEDQYVPRERDSAKRAGPAAIPENGGAPLPAQAPGGQQQSQPAALDRGAANGGTVPGSGFPLTPFVLLILALILAAIAARVAWTLRQRSRSVRAH